MPHLTPMSWITAMIMTWTLITIISVNQWSNKPMKFNKPSHKKNNTLSKHNWTW